MAKDETPNDKPEEPSAITMQTSVSPLGVTLTEEQTETERDQAQPSPGRGTIIVTSHPAAKFKITGPTEYSGSVDAFTQAGVPAGEYTITYEAVPGFMTPPPETKTLSAGSSISFVGKYTQQPSAVARIIGLASYSSDVQHVVRWTLRAFYGGLLLAAFGALAFGNWRYVFAALLWSVACVALGSVLGFLFGIPRTLQTEGQAEIKTTEYENPSNRTISARRTTGINTNLEQISDWLTKILVGVGLVQLGEVTKILGSAAVLIAKSLGGPEMESFAYALIMYFTLIGFLGSYLLTRLFLQKAFEERMN